MKEVTSDLKLEGWVGADSLDKKGGRMQKWEHAGRKAMEMRTANSSVWR